VLSNEYELIIIIRPDLDEAAVTAAIEKIEGVISSNEGTVLIREDWGKRKLAYPIKKHIKGHYVLINFIADPLMIMELERNVRIMDSVVRFLTSKIGTAVDVPLRLEQAAELRKRRAEEEARVRAEAEARAEADAAAAAQRLEFEAQQQPPTPPTPPTPPPSTPTAE
jgi:small subunit ribosomal protein S6